MENDLSLIEAVEAGNEQAVVRLLNESPQPSELNQALYKARTVEIARLLVEHGGDVNAGIPNDRTPLYSAVRRDQIEIAKFLIEKGAIVNETTVKLTDASTPEIVQLLIEHNASIEIGLYSRTPLMKAAETGRADLAEVLIRHGANVNASSSNNTTSLMLALKGPHFSVVRMLLEAGALVNSTDNYLGNTALHVIVDRGCGFPWRDTPDVTEMVELLVAKGADLCARNFHGEMSIHIALKHRNFELVALLKCAMNQLEDPYPPLPGSPHSERICCHPYKSEAVTVVRHAGLARWWLEEEPRLLARIQTHFAHFALAVSPNGDFIVIAYGDTIEIRRWDDLGVLSTFVLPEKGVPEDWREWASDSFAAASDAASNMDTTAKLTSPQSIHALALSPDGRIVAVIASIGITLESSNGWGSLGLGFTTVYFLDQVTGAIVDRMELGGKRDWLAFASNALLFDGAGFGTIKIDVQPLDDTYHVFGPAWYFGPEPAEEEEGESDDEDEQNELEDDEPKECEEPEPTWPPYCLDGGAVSPSSRWIAYSGSWGERQVEAVCEIAVHSLEDGELMWHRLLDAEIIGSNRYLWRDHRTEVLFLSDEELVCGATCGTLLFFEAATGKFTRRHYLDTKADVYSLSIDRQTSILWVALSDGQLASVSLASIEIEANGCTCAPARGMNS